MMFSREDFKIDSVSELIEFLPIAVFIGLVTPFLIAAYALGVVMNMTGWLKAG
jgi:hypothetical protein